MFMIFDARWDGFIVRERNLPYGPVWDNNVSKWYVNQSACFYVIKPGTVMIEISGKSPDGVLKLLQDMQGVVGYKKTQIIKNEMIDSKAH